MSVIAAFIAFPLSAVLLALSLYIARSRPHLPCFPVSFFREYHSCLHGYQTVCKKTKKQIPEGGGGRHCYGGPKTRCSNEDTSRAKSDFSASRSVSLLRLSFCRVAKTNSSQQSWPTERKRERKKGAIDRRTVDAENEWISYYPAALCLPVRWATKVCCRVPWVCKCKFVFPPQGERT